MKPLIELLYPIALVTVAGALGYSISEFKHSQEHTEASSRCYSTRSVDAYISKLGTDEYVCFREDINRKKISKTLIVLPDRPME